VIDWAVIEPGLVTIFRALSGVTEVRWEGATARMAVPAEGAVVDLFLISMVGVGQDELRFTSPADPEDPIGPWGGVAPLAVETAVGWREIVVRAKVTSAFQSPGWASRVHVERIRDRLRWSDMTKAINVLGLGFSEIASSVDLSRIEDQRMRSISAIDVRFNAISEAVNPTGMPTIADFSIAPPREL